jgi:hypothetical protein
VVNFTESSLRFHNTVFMISLYCLVCVCDYKRGLDWRMDILNNLQVVTLSLMFTLYTSLRAKSSQSAFTSRFLVTDLNNEDSPDSVLTPLLSGEYPATELTQPAWGRYIASGRTQQKTAPPTILLLLWAVL